MDNKDEMKKAIQNLLKDTLSVLHFGVHSYGFYDESDGKKYLHISFKNSAYKKEWEANEKYFRETMRQLYKERNLKDIVVFHGITTGVATSKRETTNKEVVTRSGTLYREQSFGNFENNVSNPAIREIFEKIRNSVKVNRQKELDNNNSQEYDDEPLRIR